MECFIHFINCPLKSLDSNLIENVWHGIKKKMRNRKPNGGWSLETLRSAVLDIWEHESPLRFTTNGLTSFPTIEAVIDRKVV